MKGIAIVPNAAVRIIDSRNDNSKPWVEENMTHMNQTYGWKPQECTLNRQQRKQYHMLCTAAIFQNLERMKMKKDCPGKCWLCSSCRLNLLERTGTVKREKGVFP